MKSERQHSVDTGRLLELIADIPVAMLTNVDAYGALTSRPMLPLKMDADGVLWFYVDLRSTKVEHLALVNLSFVAPERGTYVSLSGRGVIDTDRDHIARLWTSAAQPWFPDGQVSPNLVLLKVLPDAAEYWDAPHSRMLRMFAMAASVVAGRTIGMGEHDTLSDLSQVRAATRAMRRRKTTGSTTEDGDPGA